MTPSDDCVLIIGAGLGGLALAQGLKKAGISFRVFERDISADFRPQGYRVRINLFGGAALKETLDDRLFDLFEKTCAEIRMGMTGINAFNATVTRTGDDPASRLGKPPGAGPGAGPGPGPGARPPGNGPFYGPYTADRKTFRNLLLLGLENHVEFGKTFERYKIESENQITAYFKDGTRATGRLLVGADGIRSAVRRQGVPELELVDTTGRVIYGKTPITPELNNIFPAEAMQNITAIKDERPVTVFLEPVRWKTNVEKESEGKLSNTADYIYWVLGGRKEFFGVDDDDLYKMTGQEVVAHSLALTKDWDPKIRALFELQSQEQASVLRLSATGPNVRSWEPSSVVTFLGDAIHPMPPTGGAGANTALRDASSLLKAIKKGVSKESIEEYENELRMYAREAIIGSFHGGKSLLNLPAYEDCKKLE
ncbi:hypothetical protein BGZ59_001208 [Podila verticillata]|nr:hypothetical protein BGZ59_001208 [Podila verticillata]